MRDRSGVALAPSPAHWPADDTEESVLGTDLHQAAIRHLIAAINEAAALATTPGDPPLWHAGGQTMVGGFQHPDGSDYTTYPDVFVYPHGWDPLRGSLDVALDGPPLLIIEVLSKETYENDRDLVNGKGYSYRAAGVPAAGPNGRVPAGARHRLAPGRRPLSALAAGRGGALAQPGAAAAVRPGGRAGGGVPARRPATAARGRGRAASRPRGRRASPGGGAVGRGTVAGGSAGAVGAGTRRGTGSAAPSPGRPGARKVTGAVARHA